MASISDIRQQYPQYNDMSDQQLADAMYKAHYSDMPRDQFNAKIGFSAPQQSTAPPSTWDRIVASPIGREINKAVIQPAASVLGQAGDALNAPRRLMGMGPDPLTAAFSTAPMVASRAYDESVANNRNTPGYPAARAQADKVQANVPSGLAAQVTPGMNAMVPGLANMGGGMDAMNAAQDSAEAAQGKYKQAHPVSSFLANMAGGLLLAPKLPEVGAMPPLRSPNATPNDAALSYVENLMQSSPKAPDAAGLRAVQASANGKPITAAEAIGKPAEVAVGALARREGGTADAMAAQLSGRTADMPERVLGDFAGASGINPNAARGDIQALVQNGREQAAPLYKDAVDNAGPIHSDRLMQFLADPIMKRGINRGLEIQRLESLAKGEPFNPTDYAITGYEDGNWERPKFADVPNMRLLDAGKKGLDAILREDYTNPVTQRVSLLDPRARAIDDVRKAYISQLDSLNPPYKVARGVAGDYLSAQSAFDNGGKMVLNGNLPAADFSSHFNRLSPAEQEAFKGGVANKLFNLAQNGQLTPRIFNRPIVQSKLTALLGEEKASQFIGALQSEGAMQNFTRLRVSGAGSPTAEYNAAMDAQDAGHNISPDAINFMENAATHGPKNAIGQAIASKGRAALDNWATRGMPTEVRNEAGRLLLGNPGDLAKILESHIGTVPQGRLLSRPHALGAPIPLGLLNLPPLLLQKQQPQR